MSTTFAVKTEYLEQGASSSTFPGSPKKLKRKYQEKDGVADNNDVSDQTHSDVTVRNQPRDFTARRKRARHYSGSSNNDVTAMVEESEQEKERWKRRMSYKRSQSFSERSRDPLGLDPNPPASLMQNGSSVKPPVFNHDRSGQKHRKDRVIHVPKHLDRQDPLQLNVQIKAYKASHHDGGVELSKRGMQAERFRYGNYNRYYGIGYRDVESDPRLPLMRREWFEGKDCLDVGCNTGQFTLALTKAFIPRMMVGVDIDQELVCAARRNIRHYMTDEICQREGFPKSLPIIYGPIAAPAILDADANKPKEFPYNCAFLQCNYVPADDAQCERETEEFDTILALSVTKWIHLNWGDAGLKRFFARVFRHLRPGGRFLLEPQEWSSYQSGKNKGKLTVDMKEVYHSLKLRPDQFQALLLSPDIGFSSCERIEPDDSTLTRGFKRCLLVLTKGPEIKEG